MSIRRSLVAVFLVFSFLVTPVFAADMGGVNIHGFISQGYLKTSENNFLAKTKKGSYEYNDAGINFSMNVTDELRLGLQMYSRDLGDAGNNKIVLDWAYADYRLRNELGVRLGKVKMPMGLYNNTRDIDALRTWVLLPQCIYDENYRNYFGAISGASVYGSLDAKFMGSFDYQSVIGTLENSDQDSTAFTKMAERFIQPYNQINQPVSYSSMGMRSKAFEAGLVWNTPLDGLRLGYTYMRMRAYYDIPASTQTNLLTGMPSPERNLVADVPWWTVSLEYKWRDLTLAGEYFETKYKVDYDAPELEAMLAGYGVNPVSERLGYYGSIAYRFTDWLELGSYYAVYYANKHDKKGEGFQYVASIANANPLNDYQAWQKDISFTARFDINYSWVFKLEGHHINGAALVYDFEDAHPEDVKKIWSLYAAKVSFNF